jgi:curved DNA-binding protein CbpA
MKAERAATMNTGSGIGSEMTLQDALALFRRLGVNVESISRAEFNAAYMSLARRLHPDVNPSAHELMANLNQARSTILKSYHPG